MREKKNSDGLCKSSLPNSCGVNMRKNKFGCFEYSSHCVKECLTIDKILLGVMYL